MRLLHILLRCVIALGYAVMVGGFFLLSGLVQALQQLRAPKLMVSDAEQALNGVSFIIPTWNKKALLLKCLELLDARLAQEGKGIAKEIIVVENGSTDGTLEALQKLTTKTKLVILASETNLGFSRGINWGVQEAKYNYVYLLNNDMEVQTHFLDSILETAQKLLRHTVFFGIASQIFFYDPSKRREESGKNYCFENFGFLNVAHYVESAALTASSPTLYPGGGSALFNRKLFLALGGYDHEAYVPLYCEDLDAGVVAWKYGFPSFFEPASVVIHHHQSSSKSLARQPEFFMHKNWLVVLLKNLNGGLAILKHLLLFPVRIVLSDASAEYAMAALRRLFVIFKRRLNAHHYKLHYSGAEILNFDSFELRHDFKNA